MEKKNFFLETDWVPTYIKEDTKENLFNIQIENGIRILGKVQFLKRTPYSILN